MPVASDKFRMSLTIDLEVLKKLDKLAKLDRRSRSSLAALYIEQRIEDEWKRLESKP